MLSNRNGYNRSVNNLEFSTSSSVTAEDVLELEKNQGAEEESESSVYYDSIYLHSDFKELKETENPISPTRRKTGLRHEWSRGYHDRKSTL